MDERPEPKRIEIELTPHEPIRGQRPTEPGDDDAVVATGEPTVGMLETERGRLIAATAFIGVLALLIGVLVGRVGSGGEVATADSAATTTTVRPRSSTTVSGDAETLPTVRTLNTPPPTAPPVATTPGVDHVEPTNGVIAVAPEFVDLGVEVIGLTVGGDAILVDPASGSTVTYQVGSSFSQAQMAAGPGWILASPVELGGRSGAVVLTDDGTRTLIDTGGWWPFGVSADGSGRFWLLDERPDALRMVEMSISGVPTGSEFDLTSYPRLVDPRGGIVVDAPGGSYLVTPEGATRVSPGTVVAAGRHWLLVEECDENLECGHFMVDRATGARRRIELESGLGGLRLRWNQTAAFNEAEDALLVTYWDPVDGGGLSVGVVDLETGDFDELPDLNPYENGSQNVLWGPGDRLFWLDALRYLNVFDPETGESVLFSDELGQLNGFALRPFAP